MKKVLLVIGLCFILNGCVTTRTTKFFEDGKEVARIEAYGAGKHSMKTEKGDFQTDSKASSVFKEAAQLYVAKKMNEDD